MFVRPDAAPPGIDSGAAPAPTRGRDVDDPGLSPVPPPLPPPLPLDRPSGAGTPPVAGSSSSDVWAEETDDDKPKKRWWRRGEHDDPADG